MKGMDFFLQPVPTYVLSTDTPISQLYSYLAGTSVIHDTLKLLIPPLYATPSLRKHWNRYFGVSLAKGAFRCTKVADTSAIGTTDFGMN